MDASSANALAALLRQATDRKDVRQLICRHDQRELDAAWGQLSRLDRAALECVRVFDGTIFHDLDESDFTQGRPPLG